MIVIGSTQKHAYIGDGSIAPCLNAAMGLGGGHIPMLVLNDAEIGLVIVKKDENEESICLEVSEKRVR